MVIVYQSLMSRFNVQGFPTILVFGADKDSPTPYEGARTALAIESFALEQLETNVAPPEVTELTSPVGHLLLYSNSSPHQRCLKIYKIPSCTIGCPGTEMWLSSHLFCCISSWHFGLQGWRKKQIPSDVVVRCREVQEESLQASRTIHNIACH